MRYHKPKNSRTVAAWLVAVTAVAAVAAVAIGISGWPQDAAIASPYSGLIMLGVDEDTAVTLGPEVTADVKFESSEETSTPVEAEHALLLVGTAKAVAPVAKAKKVVAAKPVAKRPVARRAAARTGGWKSARVSWYGPGFYGNTMAGGGTLRPDSMVVAHRSLPFGTKVQFKYRGMLVTAVVKDRGPYVGNRQFDLGPGTAKALGFSGVGTVQYKVLGR